MTRTGVRAILLLAFALVAFATSHAHGVEPRRPGQQNFISRAVFAVNRLWLLTDAGDLSTITADPPNTLEGDHVAGPGWRDVCFHREDRELLQDDFRLRHAYHSPPGPFEITILFRDEPPVGQPGGCISRPA